MRFFCFNVFFIAFCLVCEVVSDYSELMLPSKDHRTMRLNMRVGKRFGDSVYDDDEAQKKYLRLQSEYDTDLYTEDALPKIPFQDVKKRELYSPKRRLRLVLRPGKRNYDNPEQTQFYTNPYQGETFDENSKKDPKRSSSHFLMNPRVGKNDKNWKLRPLINLQKRSDPKATDLWFGPRLGRSNDKEFNPWNYIVLRNDVPKAPVYKSSLDDDLIENSTN